MKFHYTKKLVSLIEPIPTTEYQMISIAHRDEIRMNNTRKGKFYMYELTDETVMTHANCTWSKYGL